MTLEKLWSGLEVAKFPTEKLLRENIEVLDKLCGGSFVKSLTFYLTIYIPETAIL